jgi:hypothetical protein
MKNDRLPQLTISVSKIVDDCGFAVCDEDRDIRIDVFPPIPGREPEHAGPTVHLFSGPFLTPDKAREYIALLEAAADHAETLGASASVR